MPIRLLVTMLLLADLAMAEVPAKPPPGKYTCGVFLSGKYMSTQYVTLQGGEYQASTGPAGKYHYYAASKRIFFDSGKFEPLFASYEPTVNYPMFRLSSRTDIAVSDYTRAWRSQVCSGK